mgnify:CR=1 FL=1
MLLSLGFIRMVSLGFVVVSWWVRLVSGWFRKDGFVVVSRWFRDVSTWFRKDGFVWFRGGFVMVSLGFVRMVSLGFVVVLWWARLLSC